MKGVGGLLSLCIGFELGVDKLFKVKGQVPMGVGYLGEASSYPVMRSRVAHWLPMCEMLGEESEGQLHLLV